MRNFVITNLCFIVIIAFEDKKEIEKGMYISN